MRDGNDCAYPLEGICVRNCEDGCKKHANEVRERAAFEAWCKHFRQDMTKRNGVYDKWVIEDRWRTWQARAALANKED